MFSTVPVPRTAMAAVAGMPQLSMLADRLQIELVLRNLLANALDAVVEQAGGGRRIRVSLQLLDSKRHGKASCLQLTVEDSGKGVSAKNESVESVQNKVATSLTSACLFGNPLTLRVFLITIATRRP